MKKDYKYTINGKPYTWEEFIQKGRDCGFESKYDFISTSMVAAFLRKRGYKIGYSKKF